MCILTLLFHLKCSITSRYMCTQHAYNAYVVIARRKRLPFSALWNADADAHARRMGNFCIFHAEMYAFCANMHACFFDIASNVKSDFYLRYLCTKVSLTTHNQFICEKDIFSSCQVVKSINFSNTNCNCKQFPEYKENENDTDFCMFYLLIFIDIPQILLACSVAYISNDNVYEFSSML